MRAKFEYDFAGYKVRMNWADPEARDFTHVTPADLARWYKQGRSGIVDGDKKEVRLDGES